MGRHRLRCRRHGSGIGRRYLPDTLSRAIAGRAGAAACPCRHGKNRPGGRLNDMHKNKDLERVARIRSDATRFRHSSTVNRVGSKASLEIWKKCSTFPASVESPAHINE
ncbi:hypothetical protein MESS4_830162 [Mesorhizobium sp. STM 4661]|nr:hypothetical protein MESS4_830162 [Mesorhizobium sp. STM 4661]